jgi:hypothetical protein
MTTGADAVVLDAVRSPLGQGICRLVVEQRAPCGAIHSIPGGLTSAYGHRLGRSRRRHTDCVYSRTAWLGAGLPQHVPSTTVERGSGSSQRAAHFAALGVMGVYDVVIAAGSKP